MGCAGSRLRVMGARQAHDGRNGALKRLQGQAKHAESRFPKASQKPRVGQGTAKQGRLLWSEGSPGHP